MIDTILAPRSETKIINKALSLRNWIFKLFNFESFMSVYVPAITAIPKNSQNV